MAVGKQKNSIPHLKIYIPTVEPAYVPYLPPNFRGEPHEPFDQNPPTNKPRTYNNTHTVIPTTFSGSSMTTQTYNIV